MRSDEVRRQPLAPPRTRRLIAGGTGLFTAGPTPSRVRRKRSLRRNRARGKYTLGDRGQAREGKGDRLRHQHRGKENGTSARWPPRYGTGKDWPAVLGLYPARRGGPTPNSPSSVALSSPPPPNSARGSGKAQTEPLVLAVGEARGLTGGRGETPGRRVVEQERPQNQEPWCLCTRQQSTRTARPNASSPANSPSGGSELSTVGGTPRWDGRPSLPPPIYTAATPAPGSPPGSASAWQPCAATSTQLQEEAHRFPAEATAKNRARFGHTYGATTLAADDAMYLAREAQNQSLHGAVLAAPRGRPAPRAHAPGYSVRTLGRQPQALSSDRFATRRGGWGTDLQPPSRIRNPKCRSPHVQIVVT